MNIDQLSAQASDQIKETTNNLNQLQSLYKNLSKIEEVEIATAPRETVWQDGKVSLYHFTNEQKVATKTPLLIVYALVNRWEMMDLQPDRSLIRRLLDQGIDVYLIDWGYVGITERYKTMNDYINGNIGDCVDFIRKKHKVEKVNILGVCQGGTFSLVYSALYPNKVKNLITMVTPVDFSKNEGLLFRWSRGMDIDTIVDNFNGVVPADFLNISYDLLKPMGKVKKFLNLSKIAENKAKLENFLRMEKWISDGPAQAGETYRQFIKEFYQQNKLFEGTFELDGEAVKLENINMPLLNIYAKADHLVPPACSIPLNDKVGSKDKQSYEFPGGHIGVFVGSRSQKDLAPTVSQWLIDRDA